MQTRKNSFLAATLVVAIVSLCAIFARAADPDVQQREALRAIAGTNGTVNVAIRDTNTTTDVTTRTPAFTGQILFGREGSSNRIWWASGRTTNDWVKVNQNP